MEDVSKLLGRLFGEKFDRPARIGIGKMSGHSSLLAVRNRDDEDCAPRECAHAQ
jgi:hypothetical protein